MKFCLPASRSLLLIHLLIFAVPHISLCFPGNSDDPLKLADGVYVRVVNPDSDAVSNSGFIILERSVLVVDTHFTPEGGRSLSKAIRSVTDRPVRYVVNTHAHPDHTHGNQVFPGAEILSSTVARREVLESDMPALNRTIKVTQSQIEQLRRDMETETDPAELLRIGQEIKQRQGYLDASSPLRIIAPMVTIDDSLKVREANGEVQILCVGPAHTDGDVIAFLPSSKIVFMGDLFFNDAIPNVQDAKILPWMEALERVLKLDADRFIPGHGPVGTREDAEGFLKYLQELKSMVQAALDRGDNLEEAEKEVELPSRYGSYKFQNFFPSNVQKMYEELKALELSRIPVEGPKR